MPTDILIALNHRRAQPPRDYGAFAFLIILLLLSSLTLAEAVLHPPSDEVQAAWVAGGP